MVKLTAKVNPRWMHTSHRPEILPNIIASLKAQKSIVVESMSDTPSQSQSQGYVIWAVGSKRLELRKYAYDVFWIAVDRPTI